MIADRQMGGFWFHSADAPAGHGRRFLPVPNPEPLVDGEVTTDVRTFRSLWAEATPRPLTAKEKGLAYLLLPVAIVRELHDLFPNLYTNLVIATVLCWIAYFVLGPSWMTDVGTVLLGLFWVVVYVLPIAAAGMLATWIFGRTDRACALCGEKLYLNFLTGGPPESRCPRQDDPRACRNCHGLMRDDYRGKIRCFDCDPPDALRTDPT